MLCERHHAGHVTALPGNKRLQGRRCTPQDRIIGRRGLLLHVLPEAFESEAGSHALFATLLGGLLSLPEVDGHLPAGDGRPDDEAIAKAAAMFGEPDGIEPLLPLVHVFTHYKLHIMPSLVSLAARRDAPAGYAWWDLDKVGEAALPAPVKKLLAELARR